MSDIKCPFCQQELKEFYCNDICVGLRCKNTDCLETKSTLGNKALWQELIRTRKALDTALKCLNGVGKELPWVKRTLAEITALTNGGNNE